MTYNRITPACAGNRKKRPLPLAAGRDHPRLRGEQIYFCIKGWVYKGSPPLARGTGYGRQCCC